MTVNGARVNLQSSSNFVLGSTPVPIVSGFDKRECDMRFSATRIQFNGPHCGIASLWFRVFETSRTPNASLSPRIRESRVASRIIRCDFDGALKRFNCLAQV